MDAGEWDETKWLLTTLASQIPTLRKMSHWEVLSDGFTYNKIGKLHPSVNEGRVYVYYNRTLGLIRMNAWGAWGSSDYIHYLMDFNSDLPVYYDSEADKYYGIAENDYNCLEEASGKAIICRPRPYPSHTALSKEDEWKIKLGSNDTFRFSRIATLNFICPVNPLIIDSFNAYIDSK